MKKSILLIGWDSNICLSVLYCLKSNGYDCYLLTHNPKHAARFSRFIKQTFYYNESEDLGKRILSLMKTVKFDLIMPYDEIETRKIKEQASELNKKTICSWGTDPVTFNMAIHKLTLAEFLKINQLPHPPFAVYKDQDKLKKMIDSYGFPILVKPVRSSAGRNIRKIFDQASLDNFFQNDTYAQDNYMIQPFIIGSDVTCNVICEQGNVLCYTIQESPIKTGDDFNANDNLIFKEDPEVISSIKKLMKLLNWNGVACIDLRRDEKNKIALILEINGRFWASVAPSLDKAGVNFPLIFTKLSMGEKVTIPTPKEASQISITTYTRELKKGKLLPISSTKFGSYFHDPIARIAQVMKK